MIRHAFVRFSTALALVILASGCAMQAPRYQASLDNVEVLKKAPGKASLGAFTLKAGDGGTGIGLRGGTMNSPVGNDYAAYLADAISQELTLAGKLDAQSKIVISGQLIKNDIAAGGIVTNSGEVEARIVVVNNGAQRFDKVKRAELSWESSFMGAIAIPKAQQQYPVIVQKLLSLLWGDADFLAALN